MSKILFFAKLTICFVIVITATGCQSAKKKSLGYSSYQSTTPSFTSADSQSGDTQKMDPKLAAYLPKGIDDSIDSYEEDRPQANSFNRSANSGYSSGSGSNSGGCTSGCCH